MCHFVCVYAGAFMSLAVARLCTYSINVCLCVCGSALFVENVLILRCTNSNNIHVSGDFAIVVVAVVGWLVVWWLPLADWLCVLSDTSDYTIMRAPVIKT